jgi:hypothetical protein
MVAEPLRLEHTTCFAVAAKPCVVSWWSIAPTTGIQARSPAHIGPILVIVQPILKGLHFRGAGGLTTCNLMHQMERVGIGCPPTSAGAHDVPGLADESQSTSFLSSG